MEVAGTSIIPDYDYFIPVGRHPSKEVPKGTLNKMLKDAGIKKQ